MDFGTELGGDQDFFQMFWPTIISHKIGKQEIFVIQFFIFQFASSSKCSGPKLHKYASENSEEKENANSTFLDEESPLYEFSARDISSKMQFEIILTMEGITPETGNTIQVFFIMVMVMVVRGMINMLNMVLVLILSSKEKIPIETGYLSIACKK